MKDNPERELRTDVVGRLWSAAYRLLVQQPSLAQSSSGVLLRHSALYALARGVPGLIAFLSIAIYTRLLHPEAYGQYALFVAVVGFFNAVLFYWLRMGLLRFLPAHLERPQALLSALATGFWWLAFAISGLAAIAFVLLPDSTWRGFVVLGVVLLLAQAWFELNLELARSQLAVIRYILISLVKAVLALGTGILLIVLGLGAYGPPLGLVAGMVISALVLTRREWSGVRIGAANLELLRGLLQYGLPLTATFALTFVVSSSDRLLIGWQLGVDAAGLYAASYDLAYQSLAAIMMMINLAAYPLVVRALEQEGVPACQQQLRRNLVLLLSVAVPAVTGLAVLAPNVAHVLLPEAFQEAATRVIPWIALATLFAGVRSYYLDFAFQLGRYTLGQAWVTLAAAIVNVALTLWWIPRIGLMGAAYATVAAYVLAFGLSLALGRRVFPLPPWPRDGLKVILAAAVMVLVLWPTLNLRGELALVAQTALGAVVYGLVLLPLDVGGSRGRLKHLVTAARYRLGLAGDAML